MPRKEVEAAGVLVKTEKYMDIMRLAARVHLHKTKPVLCRGVLNGCPGANGLPVLQPVVLASHSVEDNAHTLVSVLVSKKKVELVVILVGRNGLLGLCVRNLASVVNKDDLENVYLSRKPEINAMDHVTRPRTVIRISVKSGCLGLHGQNAWAVLVKYADLDNDPVLVTVQVFSGHQDVQECRLKMKYAHWEHATGLSGKSPPRVKQPEVVDVVKQHISDNVQLWVDALVHPQRVTHVNLSSVRDFLNGLNGLLVASHAALVLEVDQECVTEFCTKTVLEVQHTTRPV